MFSIVAVDNTTGFAFIEEELAAACEAKAM
jgi:hypothetical protein